MSVRVVLVDDQELLRRGMRLLLQVSDDIEVVGEAKNGRAALPMIRDLAPDVVLTDARMPQMDGLELIAALTADPPAPPIIMLTTFGDGELVRAAFDNGASGFLMKDASVEELVSAIKSVVDGGVVIDPRIARLAIARAPAAEAAPDPTAADRSPLAVLSRAELQVAHLVATGATNVEIAEQLHLAEGTVKNQVSSLLRKLEQRDRTGLALLLNRYLGGHPPATSSD